MVDPFMPPTAIRFTIRHTALHNVTSYRSDVTRRAGSESIVDFIEAWQITREFSMPQTTI